ncbi:Transcriptional antiactivator ExsD [Trichinella pseudospiralis]
MFSCLKAPAGVSTAAPAVAEHQLTLKAWKRNLPSLLASGGGAKLVVVEIDQLNGPVLRLHTVQNWLHNRTLGNGIT